MTASMSSSLVSNARKIVPSATPDASAISLVLGTPPRSRIRPRAESTRAARRSVGGRARARGGTRGAYMSECSLTTCCRPASVCTRPRSALSQGEGQATLVSSPSETVPPSGTGPPGVEMHDNLHDCVHDTLHRRPLRGGPCKVGGGDARPAACPDVPSVARPTLVSWQNLILEDTRDCPAKLEGGQRTFAHREATTPTGVRAG